MSRQTKPRSEPTAGFAYLIAGPDGLFKIGRSVKPDKRVRQIAPKRFDLRLLFAIPTANPESLEGWLHQAFAHRRVKGEWFRLTEEEVALMRSIPSADSPADLPAAVLALRQVNEADGFTWGEKCDATGVPSHGRKQINVRVDAATEELIERLKPAVAAALGVDITATDLVRLGMQAMAKQYLPPPETDKKGGKKS